MHVLSSAQSIAATITSAQGKQKLQHLWDASIIAQSHIDDYDQAGDTFDAYEDRKRRIQREREPENSWIDMLKNQRQLGATLLGVGLVLTLMGIMLFFEGNLLRLGNIAIIAGVFLLIGPNKVAGFFLKESRIQATIITSIGILLVFWGRPKLGLLIELFGLLNLFGNMFPVLLAVGRSIPVLGDIITAFEGSANSYNANRAYEPRRQEVYRRARYTGEPPPGTYDPEF